MKGQIKGLVVYDLSMQIVVETFYIERLNTSWRSPVFSYFLFIKTQCKHINNTWICFIEYAPNADV